MPRAFELKCLWQTGLVMAVVALIPPALPGQPARRDAGSLNQPVPFIPRAVLLQPAQYRRVQISPDGQWLAYITASVHGPEVHVAPIDNLGATWALKLPDATDYQDFRWAFTNQHLLLYAGGPQRYLYSYHIKEAKVTALSPQDGSTANLVSLSERSPTQAMVTLVAGGQTTLSRVNIVTGQRQPIHVSRKFDGFLVDGSYRLRLAYGRTPDEGRIFALAEGQDEALWPSVLRIEPEDCPYTRPIAFDARGDRLYMIDTRTSSRSELKALDLVTSAQETLASSPTLSVDGVLLHPSQRTLQAVRFSGIHTDWDFVDEEVAADVEYLGSLADGEIQIVSRSLDDEHWIVTFESDSAARLYFLFDRVARAANHLFALHQPLEQYKLIPMHTAEVGGEDSSTIGFFSLPTWALSQDRADRPTMPLPSVVIVHDTSAPIKHCLSPLHQLLANRGYAVISVNQSPARTHNEATLAAQWAVSEGIARVDRIAVLGRGSGTDRALEAIARQPDLFACAVLETAPGAQTPSTERLANLQGLISDVQRPLLLARGANESHPFDAMAKSLDRRQVPVTCITYQAERHWRQDAINRQSFAAIMESFLAERLGGRAEPFDSTLQAASPQVLIGSQHIPGLTQAMSGRRTR